MLSSSLYGGKIDNDFDHKILQSFVGRLFNEQAFDLQYPLFIGEGSLMMPDARTMDQFVAWIDNLPDVESPVWAGLPSNAEKLLRTKIANETVSNLIKIQESFDEDIGGDAKEETSKQVMESLKETASKMLDSLPGQLEALHRTASSMTNPLFRFLEREQKVGSTLLVTIRNDLFNLREMAAGNIKATNELRDLTKNINTNTIPKSWMAYPVPAIALNEWLLDFKHRLD